MSQKLLVQAFRSSGLDRPPCWFMRQAGRYLPEYRRLREREPDFLSFCYTPELTVEAALQPIRRYRPDAAILFSDILVVPHALGRQVAFIEGEGPVLEPLGTRADIANLDMEAFEERLQPVFQSVTELRQALPDDLALIGFAGAPWTVAVYMVDGRGGGHAQESRSLAYREPETFTLLIRVLEEVTGRYLERQIECGADVVQLFDSWAGLLPEAQFRRWVIEPTANIVGRLRSSHPEVPIIGFPRGAGVLYRDYAERTRVDGVGIDAFLPLAWAREHLQARCLVQGNLDNVLVASGGDQLVEETERLLREMTEGRFVFNLGHGVLPQTPPENIGLVMDMVQSWRRTRSA